MTPLLLPVLLSAVKSVAAAVLLFLWAASLARYGYVDQQFLGKLSRAAKVMFLPSLIFTSTARGMTMSFLRQNWMLALFGIAILVVGSIIGNLLAIALRVPAHLRPWYVLAIAIPNMVALPLVLVEALCREEQESNGLVADCIDGATTRLFTVTLSHTFLFWTICYGYVRSYAKDLPASSSDTFSVPDTPGYLEADCIDEKVHLELPIEDNGPDNAPTAIGHGTPCSEPLPSKSQVQNSLPEVQTRKSFCREATDALLEPPIVANVVALFVALSPSLHNLFYSQGAPLSFPASGLAVVGKASPAVTNLVVGGSFGLQLLDRREKDPFGIKALGLSVKAMMLLVLGRIVIVPLINMSILVLCLQRFPQDAWSRLILFFQPAGTTANVVTLLAQLTDQPQGGQMVAMCVIPQMILYVPMATLFITTGLIWNAEMM